MSFYENYWKNFTVEMEKRQGFPLRLKKITDKNYLSWSCFGRNKYMLIVSANKDKNWICVNFGIYSELEKDNFLILKNKKDVININTKVSVMSLQSQQ